MSNSNSIPLDVLPPGYTELLSSLKQTITSGRKTVELAKALTYWQIGKDIDKYQLAKSSRAGYGEKLFSRLAHDTGINERTLQQAVRVYREFPKPSAGSQFNWTAYRTLLGVKDKTLRLKLADKMTKNKMTTRQLQKEIKSSRHSPPVTLHVEKGVLYTYRLAEDLVLTPNAKMGIVDCGFDVVRQVTLDSTNSAITQSPAGTIVESKLCEGAFQLAASTRDATDLYFYRTALTRVVDGDTVILDVDLGLRTAIRQRLRLRGIDTPELGTKKGDRAKQFIEDEMHAAEHEILIKTHSPDKFGRYLVDIFLGQDKAFLNQMLLDQNLAVPYID